jgi:hypothetical protein
MFLEGKLSRVASIRVLPGSDIIESIEEACLSLGIQSGCISSCIGSLRKAAFFVLRPMDNKMGAGYSSPVTLNGPLEILSAQGTIGRDEKGNPSVHLHGAVSDQEGRVHGGHFLKGKNAVLVTCEIMINAIDETQWLRIHDPELDMDVFSPSG